MIDKNNILDPNGKNNFLFLASVIAVLCKDGPITVDLREIEVFWKGDIKRLQYDIITYIPEKTGSIIFSLRENDEKENNPLAL